MLDGPKTLEVNGKSTDPFQAGNVEPCGRYWAVVRTFSQAEIWARQNLELRGYRTFLPLVSTKRRDPVIRSLWHAVQRPLFIRYLFVVIDGHGWVPVRYTPGVEALLLTDGRPGRVPDGAVEALQAAQDAPAPDDPETCPWAPGMPCTMTTGPFEGHDAVVLAVQRRRIRLGVMLMGGLRDVWAPASRLAPR